MIILFVGNISAGKTLQAVREMARTPHVSYYSNIQTKGLDNVHTLKQDMIIKREATGAVSKGQPVYELTLNKEFWENVRKPISVILDEAHTIFNARSAMSKTAKLSTQWLSLLRKMLGQNDAGYGNLILITQLSRRVDVILREMAHQVVYFRGYFVKSCKDCGCRWKENSDMPEQRTVCRRCKGHDLMKSDYKTLMYKFASVRDFDLWKEMGMNTAYRIKWIKNSEKYFKNYDTLQIDDLFSDF